MKKLSQVALVLPRDELLIQSDTLVLLKYSLFMDCILTPSPTSVELEMYI